MDYPNCIQDRPPDEDKESQKTGDTPELPLEMISADSASEDQPCEPSEESEDLQVILPRPSEERAEGYLQEWMRRLSRT